MSDQIECSMCGREGGAYNGCETCHGRAQTQPRQYTLSDQRAGRVPVEDRLRDVNPRVVNVPGSESL